MVSVVKRGYKIPFRAPPPLSVTPVPFPSYNQGSQRALALQEEIAKMLQKGALEAVQDPDPGFYSRLFLVTKATGGWRPVIDLSPLNKFIQLTPFKMETVATVLASIRKGDFLASIDLKDAYFQIPIHADSRKYLRFVAKKQVFQFKVLCFGISSAPQVFTRVFAVVSAWAHSQGIRLLRYLDDWLILSSSRTQLLKDVDRLLSCCKDLGILINREKSDLIPKQSAKYLGMQIDTICARVFPTEKRIQNFLELSNEFLSSDLQPAILWQRLLGHMASLEKLVPCGRLRIRSLQWQLKVNWSPTWNLPQHLVPLSEEVKQDLLWWMQEDHLRIGVPLTSPSPESFLYTDASNQGWGTHLETMSTSGLWSDEQKDLHINMKELLAVEMALLHFEPFLLQKTVAVMSDNASVVAYINKGAQCQPHCVRK